MPFVLRPLKRPRRLIISIGSPYAQVIIFIKVFLHSTFSQFFESSVAVYSSVAVDTYLFITWVFPHYYGSSVAVFSSVAVGSLHSHHLGRSSKRRRRLPHSLLLSSVAVSYRSRSLS